MKTALGLVEAVNAPAARPFLKWAGGKTQLLDELLPLVPERFSAYYEPFVGGGAMFFACGPKKAMLSDANEELINCFRVVRDDVRELCKQLVLYQHFYELKGEQAYYDTRALVPSKMTPVGRAARMIFLNKTCFNGLYRVNRAGRFNVPHGSFKTPLKILDEENLRACSRVLQNTDLFVGDFEDQLRLARKDRFVYLDPPYDPASATSNFTAYTKDGFSLDDQRRLAACCVRLKARGVRILLSSADTPTTRKLYPTSHFNITRVEARRAINSKGGRRGPVGELLIT